MSIFTALLIYDKIKYIGGSSTKRSIATMPSKTKYPSIGNLSLITECDNEVYFYVKQAIRKEF